MIFIGDVHGHIREYEAIVSRLSQPSIQIGDMGIGFKEKGKWCWPEMDCHHTFFRGNHDNPEKACAHPNYLGEYGMYNGIFIVAGANSVDKAYRTEGISWWENEQLSQEALQRCVYLYSKMKPELVATHDCPTEVAECLMQDLLIGKPVVHTELLGPRGSGWKNPLILEPNRTGEALQRMFESHQPRHWVFGHWHLKKEITLRGTTFHCIPELQSLEII